MTVKRRGIGDGRTFVFPAQEARRGNGGIRNPVVGRVNEISSINANPTFVCAFDPHKRREMETWNESK